MAKTKPLSFLAYAKRRGVSSEAVRKAHSDGRLRESVVMVNGKPKIRDPEVADREWDANTRPRADRPAAGRRPQSPPAPPAPTDLDIVLTDRAMDCQVTALELFQERDSLSLLLTALVSSALDAAGATRPDGPEVAELRKRIAAMLPTVADLHDADADGIRRAEGDLEIYVTLAFERASRA